MNTYSDLIKTVVVVSESLHLKKKPVVPYHSAQNAERIGF